MSTRANLEFVTKFAGREQPENDKGEFILGGRLYKHWDGYPDGIVPLFKELAKELDKAVKDKDNSGLGHLINDGSEIGASFIKTFKEKFGDIYLSPELHGDIEYLYRLKTIYNGSSERNWELEVYDVDIDWDKGEPKELKLINTIKL